MIETYVLRPVNLVQAVFFFMCLFGIVLLWPKRRFRALCLLFGLEAALMAFNFSEETKLFQQSYLITPAFTLLTGPAFYLFVTHLVFSDQPWRPRDTWHFLPAILALFFTAQTALVIALGSFSLLCYGLLAYRQLRLYRTASQAMSSAAYQMRLDWLVYIMVAFAVIGVLDIVRLNLQPFTGFQLANTWYLLHQFSVLVLYATLIVLAIHQPDLFDGLKDYQSLTVATPDNSIERTLFEQINQIVTDQNLFRQPRLSLNDVAEILGIGSKDVSTAVNSGAGMSFCDYINRLRVQDVQRQITALESENPNLLTLGLDAGFNSKSSFNAVFKAVTGTTPKQYLISQRTN